MWRMQSRIVGWRSRISVLLWNSRSYLEVFVWGSRCRLHRESFGFWPFDASRCSFAGWPSTAKQKGQVLQETEWNWMCREQVWFLCWHKRILISTHQWVVTNFYTFRFLRAVSYRWLARWLFGPLGWQNTRPLAACVYHNIRKRYHTADVQGYVSGKERADSDEWNLHFYVQDMLGFLLAVGHRSTEVYNPHN